MKNLIIISLAILLIQSCYIPFLNNNDSFDTNNTEPGELTILIEMKDIPAPISTIKGSLMHSQRDDIYFTFALFSDIAAVSIKNVIPGQWTLKVDAFDSDGRIAYSFFNQMMVNPAVITPVYLQPNLETEELEIGDTWSEALIYYDDFNSPINRAVYQQINGDNFLMQYNNGWKVLLEDLYPQDSLAPDTLFSWYHVYDSNSESFYMEGYTSDYGMGNLWLFKHFEVLEDEPVTVTIQSRTSKIHNGSDTGPFLYVFDGTAELPAEQSPYLLDRAYFKWGDYRQSPWKDLTVTVDTQTSSILVALCVHDGWNNYPTHADFKNLLIQSKKDNFLY